MSKIKRKLLSSYDKAMENDVLGSLIEDVRRSDIVRFAYSMAYVSLLSLVPSLAAIFGLLDLFSPLIGGEGDIVNQARGVVLQHLAPASGEVLSKTMNSLLSNISFANIGITGFGSLMVTLIMLLKNIEKAFNKIFDIKVDRSMLIRIIYFWTFITLGAIIFFAGMGFMAQKFLHTIDENSYAYVISLLSYRLLAIMFVFLLYKIVPNVYVSAKSALYASLITVFLLSVALSVFKFYPVYFKSLKMIYGALVALPLLLIWLHIIWIIVLFGAIVCHRMEIGYKVKRISGNDPESAKERYSCLDLKLSLPFKLLDYIFDEKLNPKGCSRLDLAGNFSFPHAWLSDALELLRELGIIHFADNEETMIYPSMRRADSARRVLVEFAGVSEGDEDAVK